MSTDSRGVAAGNGWNWIASAWPIFKAAPGTWIGMLLVFLVLIMLCGVVPFAGPLAASALWPVFVAGWAHASRSAEQGGTAQFSELFAGFKERFGPLIVVGLISLAVSAAVFVAVFAVMGVGIFAVFGSGQEQNPEAYMALGMSVVLGALIAIALLLPLAMATWFAPLLILFDGMAPIDSMKASFVACLKNILPFIVYGVVLFFLSIVASIPFGLGWLVLGPLMGISVYTGYRDIYAAG